MMHWRQSQASFDFLLPSEGDIPVLVYSDVSIKSLLSRFVVASQCRVRLGWHGCRVSGRYRGLITLKKVLCEESYRRYFDPPTKTFLRFTVGMICSTRIEKGKNVGSRRLGYKASSRRYQACRYFFHECIEAHCFHGLKYDLS